MNRILVASILVLTACSGGSDGGSATDNGASTAGTDDPTSQVKAQIAAATATAQQLLDLSGGDAIEPSVALLVAADRGYPADEIFTAIAEQHFLLDGIITDTAGNPVRPTGVDTDIITDKPPLQSLRGAASEPFTMAGLADQLRIEVETVDLTNIQPGPLTAPSIADDADADVSKQFVLSRLHILLRHGRSVEDIVNTIVLGDFVQCIDLNDTMCDDRGLFDDGPGPPPQPAAPVTESSEEADGTFETGTYLGEFVAGSLIDPEGTILENTVALDVTSGSVVGDITFLGEGEFLGGRACVYIFVPIEAGDLSLKDDNTFSGSVGVDIGADLESGCNGRRPGIETFADTITITVTGSTLTGTLAFDGDPETFTAAMLVD